MNIELAIVLDLEATCWEYRNPLQEQEIIEIGAYKVDLDGNIIAEFDRLVKPVKTRGLSSYCKSITGITDADLNKAQLWPEVYREFLDWIQFPLEECMILAWGRKDLQWILSDCNYHGIDTVEMNYLDMKEVYHRMKDFRKYRGLMKVLEREGIEFEGQVHHALDDSYGLTKLYLKYRGEWQNYFYLT